MATTASVETVKGWFEWVEHGKTILDVIILLASLGGGSIVKTLVEQYSSLPVQWLTTIWIFSTALILFVVMKAVPSWTKPATADEHPNESRTSRLFPLLVVASVAFVIGRYTADVRPTVRTWDESYKALDPLIQKTFVDTQIELDGKRIENSTLRNVTLIYRGEKPYILANNALGRPIVVKVVEGPQGEGASVIGLMVDLCKGRESSCDVGGISVHIVDDNLQPVTPH